MDKAGRSYWDREWSGRSIPSPVDPRARGLRRYPHRAFHRAFARALEGVAGGGRLLEIGCGRSAWLPYFARELGFQVTGLDYSEIGCAQEREVLDRAGVEGEVICADLFHPPERLLGAFDVVVSLGVVEHFEDTAACLRACARFLRPGGRMLTEIPNMRGLPGWVTRALDRPTYDIHVPLDREELARAHEGAGLRVIRCEYLLPFDWSVLGLMRLPSPWVRWPALGASLAASALLWTLDERGLGPPANRVTSPYLLCAADRPAY